MEPKTSCQVENVKIRHWPRIYGLMAGFFTELGHRRLAYTIYMATFRSTASVLVLNGKVVGVVIYKVVAPGEYWLDYLVIDPDHRGRGLASQLLEGMESRCRDEGCESIALAVLIENQPALSFYRQYGFAEVNSRSDGKIVPRSDGKILLRKQVADAIPTRSVGTPKI